MHKSILKKLYWAISVPISSRLGFIKLKDISEEFDNDEWLTSFSNKKVLIVGTGPSLDRVNESYFLKFDTIVYINHAIKCSGSVKNEYFFSTDINGVKDINSKDYYQNIKRIGKNKSIVAPIFFQQVFFLKKEFIKDFSWISANRAAFKVHKISRSLFGFNLPVTAVYWPKQPNVRSLESWFLQNNQVKDFPVMETTSALSAILFVAKYNPKEISLIGCDFGSGRSLAVINDCPATEENIFSEAVNKFYFLQKYFKEKSILLINDSWI